MTAESAWRADQRRGSRGRDAGREALSFPLGRAGGAAAAGGGGGSAPAKGRLGGAVGAGQQGFGADHGVGGRVTAEGGSRATAGQRAPAGSGQTAAPASRGDRKLARQCDRPWTYTSVPIGPCWSFDERCGGIHTLVVDTGTGGQRRKGRKK